jgi:hypothetical protein
MKKPRPVARTGVCASDKPTMRCRSLRKEEAVADVWRAMRRQRAELESELPEGATVEAGRFGIGITRPNEEFRYDDERRTWIIHNLDRFASVLGPRMNALV